MQQVNTVSQKRLDGHRGMTQQDLEIRKPYDLEENFRKLVDRSWKRIPGTGNKEENTITGQVRGRSQAIEPLYIEELIVPASKIKYLAFFGRVFRFGKVATKTSMTTVGRWMSKAEYELMTKTGQMVEGAGGQTFVTTGGPGAFNAAAKGSVYAEFQVPTSSLLQGGQANWFKVIGPNAGKAMQGALQKQGGQLLPRVHNLSPILKTK